ncbi:MAG: PDZ domain-containing protein, partial [Gemmatimonadetes bacterium]|nr:PDZ domain-containing protein [Gemmatimonadota bacterium]
MLRRCALVLVSIAVAAISAMAQAPTQGALGFYRFPAIHGNTIVFAAEGDLWSVPTSGGLAHRLTTHAAEETDPVISPDGKTLAFTARYEGQTALYTMPIAGGSPTRWTYDGDAAVATAWTPDSRLVYKTTQYASIPKVEMVELNLGTNTRTRVPLAGASEGSYDASGKTIYFVRPGFHNNVTKRYTGGTARQIWKYTTGSAEAVQLTGQDYNGESHSPMWFNGRVYFVTDRDGQMNVWSMKDDGTDRKQITKHVGWDVRNPKLGADGKIVYQLQADLWLLDIASGQTKMVPISLATDLDQLRERWVKDPLSSLSSAHLSNDGDRVVLTSRGRVFVAPVKGGRLVRASTKDSVRFRDAVFSSDGKSLLTLSDESGEFEWVRLPANGVGNGDALTKGGNILRFRGVPSGDGKWLAWNDNNNDLWVMHLATKEMKKVSENREGTGAVAWSPDHRWLAYEMSAANSFQQIKIYSVESGKSVALTSDRTNSSSPAWDTKGEFIYFLSDRNLRTLVGAPWGNRRPEPYFDKEVELYQVALRPGLRSPFLPNDELHKPAPSPARFDSGYAGQMGDSTRLAPKGDGNYGWLAATGDALFYTSRGSGADGKTDLMALKIGNEKPEPVVVVDAIRSAELSGNTRKLLVRKDNAMFVLDARASKVGSIADNRLDLSSWTFSIDPRDDFRQLFVDAWRMERDWFYDPSMHGVDYKAALKKYGALVPRITTRAELNDLIGWAVGELSALHTSVGGGDLRRGDDNIAVASLGARLFRDPAKGGYRIDYIYRADPEYPAERAPLADPDLNVKIGDVITAVNGTKVLTAQDIGELLRAQGGKQVLLTIGAGTTARDIIVEPIGNESTLRYSDWEYTRRLAAEEKSGGAVGYVHLRAMGNGDIDQFYRQFTPVFNKQGLILDMRQNRGGNIDSWVLEMLSRKAWMYWQNRVGAPYWNMQGAFRGHMVMLVDQETASDGEAVADGFRRLGRPRVCPRRSPQWSRPGSPSAARRTRWASRASRSASGCVRAAGPGWCGSRGAAGSPHKRLPDGRSNRRPNAARNRRNRRNRPVSNPPPPRSRPRCPPRRRSRSPGCSRPVRSRGCAASR